MPNFARFEHLGRRDLAVRVSLYGRPEQFQKAGLGRILVPARPGYSRVKVSRFEQVAMLVEALDLAWQIRASKAPRRAPSPTARS